MEYLQSRADHLRIFIGQAGEEGVGVTGLHHHHPKMIRIPHPLSRHLQRHTFALSQVEIFFGILLGMSVRACHIHDLRREVQTEIGDLLANDVSATEQDRFADAVVFDQRGGTNDL